jgi:hypothetical protein
MAVENAARQHYHIARAEIELKFRDDVDVWRTGVERDPPMDGRLVCHGLWAPTLVYLTSEIENYAAREALAATNSVSAVSALRSEFAELIRNARTVWDRELYDLVSQEDIESNWPPAETHSSLIAPFERFFFGLEVDLNSAEWPGAFPLRLGNSIFGEDRSIFGISEFQPWYSRLAGKTAESPESHTLGVASTASDQFATEPDRRKAIDLYRAKWKLEKLPAVAERLGVDIADLHAWARHRKKQRRAIEDGLRSTR